MIRLSYIIPCYNVEAFISECLDSIFAQDLAPDEYEVICVDDCSTDKTPEIIREYQHGHSNLRLIEQPRNLSQAAARNRALDTAQGDYIWFIDSDDFLKAGNARMLLGHAESNDLDILLFNFEEVREHGKEWLDRTDIFVPSPVLSGTEYLQRLFPGKMNRISLVWLCLFRSRLLTENAIRFPLLHVSEDSIFLWKCLFHAARVESVAHRGYIHRINRQSIIQTPANFKRSYCKSFAFPKEMRALVQTYAGRIPDLLIQELQRYIRYETNQFALRYKQLGPEDRHRYFQAMATDREWFTLFKEGLSGRNKLVYFSSFAGEKVFNAAVRKITH